MASTFVQSSPAALNRFFRDISSKFSPGESEDVVKSSKRIYGEQFNSVDNQDLLSCLNLLYKLGYVSNTKLTLVKEFVATKSNKEKDINDTIDNFKESLPPQADPEKELQGRIDDFKNITEKLEAGQPSVVNLFGSAGVGKTTLAKEICEKWRGKDYVFDLREAKDMRAVYVNILNTLKLSVPVGLKSMMNYAVGKIHEHIGQENVGKRVLFLLDNVEQFTAGKGKEGKNLKTGFMMFLGTLSQLDDNSKVKGLSILLTSRTQLHDVKNVSDYELEPLKDSFSEKILFSMETSDLNTKQKEKLLCACKGKPLLLKGMEAILMQGRKAPSDLVDELEKLMASKEKAADIPVQSKSTEDAKEKAFDLEKEGVDEDETSVIEEMFNTLSSDSLKAAAVSISLFCGPFSASTAAKILDISQSEAVAQLEGLVTSAIIFVVNREAKELMYDIHPLLRKYACSIKDDAKFTESYTRAKKRFYDHFMSKMKTIAGSIEPNYVEAFNLFADDRPNYDFAIEISLQPEFFSVPANFHDIALIESVFSALLSNEKQLELFHSWAKMCEEDTKSGSLSRAYFRCWEARQVLDVSGIREAFEVLQLAAYSLKQVQDQTTKSFKVTQGLFSYVEGEIHCQNRDFKKALECLQTCLDVTEELLKVDTNLARCYNAMGNCYYGLGKPQKALEFYTKALDMRKELSGGSERHYDMPVYKNQIGIVYEAQEEYDEAVKWYLDALRLQKELQMSGSKEEAVFRRNLSNVYSHQRKFKEAIEPAERAYKIRQKQLGNHPDTVQSIFQLGVIQANLKHFDETLNLFLKAWEMEKNLKPGNHSKVWKRIIDNVIKYLGEGNEKEKFRSDALNFCQRFWKEETASSQFSFTEHNRNIIDEILVLLGDEEENRDARDKYEEEALSFYDGMQDVSEKDFFYDLDQERDNKKLNEMFKERKKFLDRMQELSASLNQDEKLTKLKRRKLKLYQAMLVREDFIGEKEKGHDKLTLKRQVEQLYLDLGEKGSISEFRQQLLSTWQAQWEEKKGIIETKETTKARVKTIEGILLLCQELKRVKSFRKYEKEALTLYEKMWKLRGHEMKPAEKKGHLRKIKDLASSVGDYRKRTFYQKELQKCGKEKEPSGWRSFLPFGSVAQRQPDDEDDDDDEDNEVEESDKDEDDEVEEEEKEDEEGEELEQQQQEEEDEENSNIETGENSEGGDEDLLQPLAELQLGEQQVAVEEDPAKTRIHEGTVSSEGAQWNLKLGAVHLTFPPDAVSEPTLIVVHRWKCSACSPPLQEHEAVASCVIDISTNTNQALEFNSEVKLVLSHSAPDLKGYELVIKRLNDKESNEWEEVDGSEDIRRLSDIEDDYPSRKDIPDFSFPVVQADITECSTYTVVCRLRVSPFYTLASNGGTFSHPDYPGATVTVPKKAVPTKARFPLQLKVQEVPSEEWEGINVFVGPIMRIDCSQSVVLLKAVEIQLPVSLCDEQEGIPDPSVCRVRVLFLRSDGESKEWSEITGDLDSPASFDGAFVKFQVKRFSGYAYFLDWCKEDFSVSGIVSYLSSIIWNQPRDANFFAYFRPSERLHSQDILHLICCPAHLRETVKQEHEKEGIISCDVSSKKKMIPGRDKAFVFVSGGISPVDTEDMDDFYLRFEGDFQYRDQLPVRLIDDKVYSKVEFRSTRKPTGKNLLNKLQFKLSSLNVDRQKTPVEFFGVPLNDEILLQARASDVLGACRSFVTDDVYEGHFHRLTNGNETEKQVLKSFFEVLAGLESADQEECFEAIVNTLRRNIEGLTHVVERLQTAREMVTTGLLQNNEVIRMASDKVGALWKKLARQLELKSGRIDMISDEENDDEDRCHKALETWCHVNGEEATIRELMICLTKAGLAEVNNDIMRCLGLLSKEGP